ncbi:MAG: monovalent cation/H(+) antiporter subunit G [Spirochaetes bacterium]|nr:monovalent cation/H(+) antiporter subunit G [Spirochaetota bacterium]
MELAGDIIIWIGTAFVFFGVVGIFKFDNFYTRMLVAAKIDVVGIITIITGIVVRHGLSFFSLKSVLLLGVMLLLTPMVSHMIARAAYLSGYQIGSISGQADKKDADSANDI